MRSKERNSGRRVQRPACAMKTQVSGLEDSLAGMTRQMRRHLLSLCGTTEAKGEAIVQHMRALRQRMFATRRQIANLKYQRRARN
jgi:hypothetical protein